MLKRKNAESIHLLTIAKSNPTQRFAKCIRCNGLMLSSKIWWSYSKAWHLLKACRGKTDGLSSNFFESFWGGWFWKCPRSLTPIVTKNLTSGYHFSNKQLGNGNSTKTLFVKCLSAHESIWKITAIGFFKSKIKPKNKNYTSLCECNFILWHQ